MARTSNQLFISFYFVFSLLMDVSLSQTLMPSMMSPSSSELVLNSKVTETNSTPILNSTSLSFISPNISSIQPDFMTSNIPPTLLNNSSLNPFVNSSLYPSTDFISRSQYMHSSATGSKTVSETLFLSSMNSVSNTRTVSSGLSSILPVASSFYISPTKVPNFSEVATSMTGVQSSMTVSRSTGTQQLTPTPYYSSPSPDDSGSTLDETTPGSLGSTPRSASMTAKMATQRSGGIAADLTILEWFLILVGVAVFVLLLFLACHFLTYKKGYTDGNENYFPNKVIEVDKCPPQSPKEKWRNSWALEAMSYHIKLPPKETGEEMEATCTPVFEEEPNQSANNTQEPHLTKL